MVDFILFYMLSVAETKGALPKQVNSRSVPWKRKKHKTDERMELDWQFYRRRIGSSAREQRRGGSSMDM